MKRRATEKKPQIIEHKKPGSLFETERPSAKVIAVHFRMDKVGWDQWGLLRCDAHHDHPSCDTRLEESHLEEVRTRKAFVCDFGDCFDGMQGRSDPRRSKAELMAKFAARSIQEGRLSTGDPYRLPSYLNDLVHDHADFYEPYAPHWINYDPGNHEDSVWQHSEFDLTRALVSTLNDRAGTTIHAGGYVQWIIFRFHRGPAMFSRTLWGTHGYGGGGPVTEDIIQAQRQRSVVQGFDIGVSGHTHDSWQRNGIMVRINGASQEERRPYVQVKLGCYADHYGHSNRGFVHQRGMPPKPKGAWWVHFIQKHQDEISIEMTWDGQ